MGVFGDRMKYYEEPEAARAAMPLLPLCVRVDGRCFSGFTRGLERPYDKRMSRCMIETASHLISETHALIGHTQSDEISLIFYSQDYKSQLFFDGNFQKITSVISGIATAKFNHLIQELIPEKKDQLPAFDCRAWNVPNKVEAANVLLWREMDATRNSISMAARSVYSHKQLENKNCSDMQEMMHQKGINWNDYPSFFKRGVFLKKEVIERLWTLEELNRIPEKHRPDPNEEIIRSIVKELEMPPFSKVTNRVGVVFEGEQPRSEK